MIRSRLDETAAPELLPAGRRALLPTEFISLTVIIGKAQQIELSLLVDLKLGESDGQRAEIFCDCGESTERHDLCRENIAVPRLELQVGAGGLNLHDQRIAFRRHRHRAKARIDELAGERCERRERSRVGRLGKQLGHRVESGCRCLKRLRHVVAFGIVKNPVQSPESNRIRKTHICLVGEDDNAKILIGHHADIGAEAAGSSVVPNDVAVRCLLNDPAQGIEQFVGDRHLLRRGE